MNTAQITQILQADPHTRDVFVGVYPRDHLPHSVKNYPSAYVCNTALHTDEGEHWVVIFVDRNGQGEYFDSFGLPPLYMRFVNFLDTQCTSWTFNEIQLQGLTSTMCGHHCVFYLLHRCRDIPMSRIVHMFGSDVRDNDVLVDDFLVKYTLV